METGAPLGKGKMPRKVEIVRTPAESTTSGQRDDFHP